MIDENSTIYGFKIKDLIILAKAVHDYGITQEELADFIYNVSKGYEYGIKECEEAFQRAINNYIESFQDSI